MRGLHRTDVDFQRFSQARQGRHRKARGANPEGRVQTPRTGCKPRGQGANPEDRVQTPRPSRHPRECSILGPNAMSQPTRIRRFRKIPTQAKSSAGNDRRGADHLLGWAGWDRRRGCSAAPPRATLERGRRVCARGTQRSGQVRRLEAVSRQSPLLQNGRNLVRWVLVRVTFS